MAKHLTASNVLERMVTRDELRAFILQELPGWDDWLTAAAASIQWSAWDEYSLRSEKEVNADIATFAEEFVQEVGDKAGEIFLPFLQRMPLHDLQGELPAAEPFTHSRGPMPLSHAELGDAQPSRALIGLIGALGLLRSWKRSGRRADLRRQLALAWVAEQLVPFVASERYSGTCAGLPVVPAMYADHVVTAPRTARVSWRLAALVGLYLSLPNRTDPDYDPPEGGGVGPDPAAHGFTVHQLEHTVDELHGIARQIEQGTWTSPLRPPGASPAAPRVPRGG